MARKSKPPVVRAPSGSDSYPCKFSTVNFGDETVRLGVFIPRGKGMSAAQADRLLVNAQLKIKIDTVEDGDDRGQTVIEGTAPQPLAATVHSKSVRIAKGGISFGLTFVSGKELDLNMLAQFASKPGTIWIASDGAIPEPVKSTPKLPGMEEGEEPEDDEADADEAEA